MLFDGIQSVLAMGKPAFEKFVANLKKDFSEGTWDCSCCSSLKFCKAAGSCDQFMNADGSSSMLPSLEIKID